MSSYDYFTFCGTYILRLSLVESLALLVDAAEVGDNDRHRKCYDEDAAQRTDAADDFTCDRVWNHVAVPGSEVDIQNVPRYR